MQKEVVSADDMRAWRARMGLTQGEAAVLLKRTRRAVQMWEAGDRPVPDSIGSLCVLLERERFGESAPLLARPRFRSRRRRMAGGAGRALAVLLRGLLQRAAPLEGGNGAEDVYATTLTATERDMALALLEALAPVVGTHDHDRPRKRD